jgi:group I intron endonuclease
VNLTRRRGSHFYYLRRGEHANPHLQNAWNKSGVDAFSWRVLCVLEPSEIYPTEERLLKKVVGSGSCYNMSIRTDGVVLGRKFSAEARAKMSKANLGKKKSAETRQKMSDAQRNRPPELNALIGELIRGKKRSPEQRERMRHAAKSRRRGHKHPPEVRFKIAAAQRGKKKSAEHIERMRQSRWGALRSSGDGAIHDPVGNPPRKRDVAVPGASRSCAALNQHHEQDENDNRGADGPQAALWGEEVFHARA